MSLILWLLTKTIAISSAIWEGKGGSRRRNESVVPTAGRGFNH